MANLTHRAGELFPVNAGFSFIFSWFEGADKTILCIISPSSSPARLEMLSISQKWNSFCRAAERRYFQRRGDVPGRRPPVWSSAVMCWGVCWRSSAANNLCLMQTACTQCIKEEQALLSFCPAEQIQLQIYSPVKKKFNLKKSPRRRKHAESGQNWSSVEQKTEAGQCKWLWYKNKSIWQTFWCT